MGEKLKLRMSNKSASVSGSRVTSTQPETNHLPLKANDRAHFINYRRDEDEGKCTHDKSLAVIGRYVGEKVL